MANLRELFWYSFPTFVSAAGQIAYISLKDSWFGGSEASCFAYAYAGALLVTLALPDCRQAGLLAGDFSHAMVLLAYLGDSLQESAFSSGITAPAG